MTSRKYAYPAQFIHEDNGSISVYFPDLDGCQTYDDTIEGAVSMAKDALEGYISVLLELNKDLPAPSNIHNIKTENGLVMMVETTLDENSEQRRKVKEAVAMLIREADEIAAGIRKSATSKDIFGED